MPRPAPRHAPPAPAAPPGPAAAHLTARGTGLLLGGGALGLLGYLAGIIDLVRVGALLALLPVGALAWVVVARPVGARAPQVLRTVVPQPTAVGSPTRVEVTVHAGAGGARARRRLHRLGLREQASPELSSRRPTAQIRRTADRVTLRYRVLPARRGRWRLGPLSARLTDPFGLAASSARLGTATIVAVRPRVVELPLSGYLAQHTIRVRAGARTSRADDTGLRDYRPGDDLRRVHWPTTARRGVPVVREDEHSGRRPVTVLVDLPMDPAAQEWTVSVAASVAVAALDAGHPVRVLGGRTHPELPEPRGDRPFQGPGDIAYGRLLDQFVDLTAAPDAGSAEEDLAAAAQRLVRGDHLVLGVLGPAGRAAPILAELGTMQRCAAVVRATPGRPTAQARDTVTALAVNGWNVAEVEPGHDVVDAWTRALAGGHATAVRSEQ